MVCGLLIAAVAAFLLFTRGSNKVLSNDNTRSSLDVTERTVKPQPSFETPLPLLIDNRGDGLIEGQVIDLDNNPVGTAIVQINTKPIREVTTNTDGAFTFDGLLLKEYALSARKGNASAGPLVINAVSATQRQDPLILRVKPGARLQVTVRDSRNVAVAGADIEIISEQEYRKAKSDENGQALIEGLGYGDYEVTAQATGFSRTWHELLITAPGWTQLNLTLVQGAAISGIAVDQSGKAMSGVSVAIENAMTSSASKGVVKTDGNGHWVFPVVPRGTYRFWGIPENADVTTGGSAPVEHNGINASDGVVVKMQRGRTVVGEVYTSDGHVAAGARVRLTAKSMRMFSERDFRTTHADQFGRFTFENVLEGDASLLADQNDEVSDIIDGNTRHSVKISLKKAAGLKGFVTDDNGNRVPEVQVFARSTGLSAGKQTNGMSPFGHAITDADGQFDIKGIPAGTYILRALPQGGRPRDAWDQPGITAQTGTKDISLVIVKHGRLTGKVQYRGKPVSSFQVGVAARRPRDFKNESGAFEINDVKNGTWNITIRAAGLASLTVPGVVIRSGSTTDLSVIELKGGRLITGTVRDANGNPIADATVTIGAAIEGDGGEIFQDDARSDTVVTRSDSSGQFRLGGRSSSEQIVIADHPAAGRSQPIAIEATSEDAIANARVLATTRLTGRVTVAHKDAPALIQLQPLNFSRVLFSVQSGPDGRYVFNRVTPDQYRMIITTGRPGAFDVLSEPIELSTKSNEKSVDIKDETTEVKFATEHSDVYVQAYLLTRPHNATRASQIDTSQVGRSYIRTVKKGVTPTAMVSSGHYSLCAVFLPGDPDEPSTIAAQYATGDSFPAKCIDVDILKTVTFVFSQREIVAR